MMKLYKIYTIKVNWQIYQIHENFIIMWEDLATLIGALLAGKSKKICKKFSKNS